MNPGKYIVFNLDGERFGLAIESVEQILARPAITRIPKTGSAILGVFNLRGETIAVVDTGAVLDHPAREGNTLLVVCSSAGRAAITADSVEQIHEFTAENITPNDGLARGSIGSHTGRAGDQLVILLEVDEFIQSTQPAVAFVEPLELATA